MKNLIILILLTSIFLGGCANEKQDKNYVPSSKTKQQQKNKLPDDRLIIPGERVGMITRTSTEMDILNAYGRSSVSIQPIEIGEGETHKGLLIYEGSVDELEVVMNFDGKDKPAFVRITHEFSSWKTPEGITIKTGLADLQAANGMPFTFMGFEWDYAGLITNWNGGQFPKNFTVSLAAYNVPEVNEKVLGPVELQSDDPAMEKLDLKIGAIAVRF